MKHQQHKKIIFSLTSLFFFLFSFTTFSQANIPLRYTLVNLTLSASDAGSGMGSGSLMRFSNDAITWSPEEDYATSKQNWDLTLYGGDSCADSHMVYVQFADAAGNWTTQTIGATITLELPAVNASPPGGAYSSQQVVTLSAFEDDTIYYSINGKTFVGNTFEGNTFKVYSGPILIDDDTELSYFAIDACGNQGKIVTETYTIGFLDSDGDGVNDSGDNCPDVANPAQADCDGDGRGDACDIESPCSTDSDGDGVVDSDDNCPDIANVDQTDIDDDGIGDVCDDSEPGFLRVGPGQTYATIQEAIDVSLDGDKVFVYDGTYYENIDFMGKSIAVVSVNGPTKTIIDGESIDSVVIFNNVDSNALLDGFTITDGVAVDGGGIYCQQSSPTIANCIISKNSSSTYGGGIYCYQSSPTIIDCTIKENFSSFYGGGVYSYTSDIEFTNCAIFENTTNYYGGGVYSKETSAIITNCIIAGNSTLISQKGKGGGMYLWDSPSMIVNCTITGNTATYHGGAIYYGGLYSQKDIINSILWDNNVGGISDEISNIGEGTANVSYSNIEGGFPGVGNINSNPLFVSPETGDYCLQPGSACIDSANSDDPVLPIDIYNNLRYDDPLTPDTGSGVNGSYYDMGACEYRPPSE
jgi:predicted outer membrane repeat protein